MLDPKIWKVVGSEEREHKGKKYRVLFARKKGESGSKEQAYRYPLKNGWSAAEARSHCKDHHGSFEPASGEAKAATSAPVMACIFTDVSDVNFAEKDKAAEGSGRFRIMAYSGGILENHWFFGNVAFDLEGLKFAKARTPVLEQHLTDSRIGFTTTQEISDKVVVEGEFLGNEKAQGLRKDIAQGFPMQASILVPPTLVENVKSDETAEVNGRKLKGPGTIFRKAVIREISMCVLGADKNTTSTAYSENEKDRITFAITKEKQIMAEDQMTIETFIEKWPDIHAEVFSAGKEEGLAEGRQKLCSLFKDVQVACGGDCELLVACFAEGKTVEQAYKMRADKLQAANNQLGEDLVKARKAKVDPAIQEFTQGGPPPAAKFDEATATDDQLKEHFAQTQLVQDEYGDVQSYLAYIHHKVRKK